MDSGMSPNDIKKLYNIQYTEFGLFISKCLFMKLRTLKEAISNYNKQNNRLTTNERRAYRNKCKFRINKSNIHLITGYDLISTVGFCSPSNKNGLSYDHMVSIDYGWKNNIDPSIISHPANCQLLGLIDNIKKGPNV